jgi:hypothetical protein
MIDWMIGDPQLAREDEVRTLSVEEARMEQCQKHTAERTSQNYYKLNRIMAECDRGTRRNFLSVKYGRVSYLCHFDFFSRFSITYLKM